MYLHLVHTEDFIYFKHVHGQTNMETKTNREGLR